MAEALDRAGEKVAMANKKARTDEDMTPVTGEIDYRVVFSAAQVPAGRVGFGIGEEEVAIEFGAPFNRAAHPTDGEIDIAWRAKLLESPKMWDALKFRLASLEAHKGSDGPAVTIRLGVTSYKDYVGTNADGVPAARLASLRADGRANHADAHAHESRALGVETILETSDGNFVVLRRSAGVATFRGVFNGPSGHPEPKDVGIVDAASTSSAADLTCIEPSAVRRELFDSVRKECVEETGIPADKLSRPRLIGAMTDAFGKPDLLFHTRVDLTADEVGQCLSNASEAWESSGADVVDAVPPDDVERVGVGAPKKPGEKEPFRCIKLGDPAPFELGSSVVLFPPDGGEGPPASGASAMTRAFWGRDPRVMSPVTRAAADCVYMLAATREGGGEPARECVMSNALDAAMDHELHDVSRVIERRMLANAGFM